MVQTLFHHIRGNSSALEIRSPRWILRDHQSIAIATAILKLSHYKTHPGTGTKIKLSRSDRAIRIPWNFRWDHSHGQDNAWEHLNEWIYFANLLFWIIKSRSWFPWSVKYLRRIYDRNPRLVSSAGHVSAIPRAIATYQILFAARYWKAETSPPPPDVSLIFNTYIPHSHFVSWIWIFLAEYFS